MQCSGLDQFEVRQKRAHLRAVLNAADKVVIARSPCAIRGQKGKIDGGGSYENLIALNPTPLG